MQEKDPHMSNTLKNLKLKTKNSFLCNRLKYNHKPSSFFLFSNAILLYLFFLSEKAETSFNLVNGSLFTWHRLEGNNNAGAFYRGRRDG